MLDRLTPAPAFFIFYFCLVFCFLCFLWFLATYSQNIPSLSCNSNYIVHFWLISSLLVDVKFECSLKTLWRRVSWLKTSLYLASTRIFGHISWQVQQSSLNKTNSFLKAVKINGFKANSFLWNRTFSKRLNITVLQLLRCIYREEKPSHRKQDQPVIVL